MKKKIAIIGCGASGMMAAIRASQLGADVTIYEHAKPGKKILSTGNGKCNLTNDKMDPEYFFTHAPKRLQSCLSRFGKEETKTAESYGAKQTSLFCIRPTELWL